MNGKLVKTAIKLSNKTQLEAAEYVGITREHFNKLLKGDVPEEYIILLRKKGIDFSHVTKSNISNDDNIEKSLHESAIHEGKALQFFLKLNHGGISKASKDMGYTEHVYMYELFEKSEINDITWAKLADRAGIIKDDVIAKYLSLHKPNVKIQTQQPGVPVYNIDFTAGDVTQFTDFQEKVIGYIDLNGFRRCIAFVKVKGNSMFPTFTAGDLVGLEPMDDFSIIEYGQPFAIVTKSGQSLIKIIRKGSDNDNFILRSNNKEFDDIDIHRKDIVRLYKAHGPVRDSHY